MVSWYPATVASTQQGWEKLTFVHFAYEPEAIAHLVPDPLTLAGSTLTVPVEHEPWRLVQAELTDWSADGYLENLGLPAQRSEPHVLFSPGIEAKLGFPHGASDD
jgi:uncharacterized protein YqjF (DUF2071 family)